MKRTLLILILLIGTSAAIYAKKTCSQFQSWKEAETYFKAKKPGYKSLDRNHDGKPCEKLWRESLDKNKQTTRIRIYKYGSPFSYGKTFSSIGAREQEKAKLTKSNVGSNLSYKCEKK